jgi:hypothetical protein
MSRVMKNSLEEGTSERARLFRMRKRLRRLADKLEKKANPEFIRIADDLILIAADQDPE